MGHRSATEHRRDGHGDARPTRIGGAAVATEPVRGPVHEREPFPSGPRDRADVRRDGGARRRGGTRRALPGYSGRLAAAGRPRLGGARAARDGRVADRLRADPPPLLRTAGVRVSTRSSLASILISNAFHVTLPGGVAFSTGYSYRWMREHGAGPTVAGWSLAVNGLLSSACLAGLGLAASLSVGGASWARLLLQVAGVAVLVLGARYVVRNPERALAAAGSLLAAANRLLRTSCRDRNRSPGGDGHAAGGGATDRAGLDGRHRVRAAQLGSRPCLPGPVHPGDGQPDLTFGTGGGLRCGYGGVEPVPAARWPRGDGRRPGARPRRRGGARPPRHSRPCCSTG